MNHDEHLELDFGSWTPAPHEPVADPCTRCWGPLESDLLGATWCTDCQHETTQPFAPAPPVGAFARACPVCDGTELTAAMWVLMSGDYEPTALDGTITGGAALCPYLGTNPSNVLVGCRRCDWRGPEGCLTWQPQS